MLLELDPKRRSVTYAAKCDNCKIKRYERGNIYEVSEELGKELLLTKFFHLGAAPQVDPEGEALTLRAQSVVNALAGLGAEGLSRLESLLKVAAPAPDVITSKDTNQAHAYRALEDIPDVPTVEAMMATGFSEKLAKMAVLEMQAMADKAKPKVEEPKVEEAEGEAEEAKVEEAKVEEAELDPLPTPKPKPAKVAKAKAIKKK